jgi:NTP pyrophosphatase (non-canonical NTP hydrolase)
MTSDLKEHIYDRVRNALGEAHMLIMTNEELSELTKAITKYQRNKIKASLSIEERNPSLLESIADEIADVEIMTEQLKQAYQLYKKVDEYKAVKINRLEERIIVYEKQLRR